MLDSRHAFFSSFYTNKILAKFILPKKVRKLCQKWTFQSMAVVFTLPWTIYPASETSWVREFKPINQNKKYWEIVVCTPKAYVHLTWQGDISEYCAPLVLVPSLAKRYTHRPGWHQWTLCSPWTGTISCWEPFSHQRTGHSRRYTLYCPGSPKESISL